MTIELGFKLIGYMALIGGVICVWALCVSEMMEDNEHDIE